MPTWVAGFEDCLVYWLLQRYDVHRCRAKWMIRDIEYQMTGREELTLRAFTALFPKFPVILNAKCLAPAAKRAMTAERLMATLERTSLVQEYDIHFDFEIGNYDRKPQPPEGGPRFAVIFHWDQLTIQHSIVVHNVLPSRFDLQGSHLLLTRKGGDPLMLETVSVFMDGLDGTVDPEAWLASAVEVGWDTPVASAS